MNSVIREMNEEYTLNTDGLKDKPRKMSSMGHSDNNLQKYVGSQGVINTPLRKLQSSNEIGKENAS